MSEICYFERLLNIDLFKRLLTESGDIALSRVGPEMADDEISTILSRIQGYHTRGGSQLVPPKFRIDQEFITKCPNLVAVCTGGAGYDAITVPDCTQAGILVANQAGLNAEAVAEHALAMMLCLTKQIAQVNMALRRDPELDRFNFRNNDIFGKTLGIVGLGEIGTRVAEICSTAFRMPVLTTHPRLKAEEASKRHAKLVPFPELLERSDFVLVACGLNDETRDMFNQAEFKAMKPTAYFVTIGRGGIHNEDALARALKEGELAGAGLDVWNQEPPPINHPLLKFENVLASPHIAAVTEESAQKAMTGAAEQWRAILAGKYPSRCKNPEVWPHYKKRFKAIMGFTPEGGPSG